MPSLVRKRSRGGGDRASQAPKMRRSCDACAFAKRKCDGEVCCSLCRKKSIPCVYSKRQKSGPKVNTPPERGSAAIAISAAGRSSPKADKRPLSDPPTTAAGPQPKKRALSAPTASSKSQQQPHQRQQKADQPARKKQSGASPADGGGPQQRKLQKKQKQQQRQQQNVSRPSLPDAGRAQATCPNPKASVTESKRPPAAPLQPSSSSSSPPKKNLSAKALPRQQPKSVAKKEPRPRHKHKDSVGRRAPSGTNETLAARAAVISPIKKSGGGKALVVSPPVPRPLALTKPVEEIAGAAAPATATATAELVPLPVVDPQRKILPIASSPAALAVSLSESSVDGGSSSLSWDDVSDVFASSMDDDVLWSCDDFSETGAGGAGAGIGSEEFFPNASSLHGLQPKLDKMQTSSPSAVEAVLLNDDETSMSWPIASGFGIQQLQPSTSSSPIPSRPLPPQVSQKHSSISSPASLNARGSGGGVERVLLPAASGSTGGHQGSFGSNASGIVHPGDVASNPISTWTPEAVEAGASTLLAVLTSTDFCGRDDSNGDVCSGEGLRQQRNQQLQLQQQQQQQQQQHNYLSSRSNGNKTGKDHDSARQSLRWPPNHSIPACDGRLADYGGMVPRSPPPAPSSTPSFAAVASQQHHPQQQIHRQHHHRQQQQQQQQQQQRVSGSLNSRSSVSVMPTSFDGNCTASWSRKGSERHQVATL